jgi:hypothetical protein
MPGLVAGPGILAVIILGLATALNLIKAVSLRDSIHARLSSTTATNN